MKKILRVPNLKNTICTLIQLKKKWLSPSSRSTLKWVRKNELNFVKLRSVCHGVWTLFYWSPFTFSSKLGPPLGIIPWSIPFLICLETFHTSWLPSGLLVHASLPSSVIVLLAGFACFSLYICFDFTCIVCISCLFPWLACWLLMLVLPTGLQFPWG